MSDIKMVIIVRKDLHMRAGKIAAQVAHASMKILLDRLSITQMDQDTVQLNMELSTDNPLYPWITGQFTKVVLYVNTLDEMERIERTAQELDIFTAKIIDVGKTEFHNVPTPTCVALGPDESDILEKLTGDLQLV